MLRTFSAALIATALIAGPAFAQSSGTNGTPPAASATQSKVAPTAAPVAASSAKTTKTVKNTAKHAKKHVARGKSGTMHQARHVKPAKTHQAGVIGAAKRS